MHSRNSSGSKKLFCDIVVVGGGGSGLAAAVAAAEKGAQVVVVEKRKALGGNTALASGICATESRIQADMRLFVSTDHAFKKVMEYSRLEVDPRIVRAFLNKSGDTVQWLEEKGVRFDNHIKGTSKHTMRIAVMVCLGKNSNPTQEVPYEAIIRRFRSSWQQ